MDMGKIDVNDIKRIFRLKREIHMKPTEESILGDIVRTSDERARTRVIIKTAVVLAEAVLLASLVYLYYIRK